MRAFPLLAVLAAGVILGVSLASAAEEEHATIYLVGANGGQLHEVMSDDAGEGPPLSLSWTPNARALVYARSPCDGCSEIRVLRVTAKNHGLGELVGEGRRPRLARNGRTLVSVGSDGGLYVGALDRVPGRRVLAVGVSAGGIDEPDASPDGRRIAFRRAQPNGKWSIDVVPTTGGPERRLTPVGTSAASPVWSPDGRRIAFSLQAPDGRWRIAVVGADGRGLRALPLAGSASYPSWSPDGTRIAFVREGSEGDSIFTADLRGRHVRRLTPAGMDAIQPAWSPRGDRIAFVANGGEDD